jgi:hypothetical protein
MTLLAVVILNVDLVEADVTITDKSGNAPHYALRPEK